MANTNISFICGGECGKVDMGDKKTITPPEMNICFNCGYKKQKVKKIEGTISLKK